MSQLQGKNVVVTGGNGALGRAVVAELTAMGAVLHLPVFEASVPADAERWAPGARLTPGIDLASEDAVESYYRTLPELWASIHIAGGFAMAPLESTRASDLERMMKMNFVSAFLCCREAVQCMRGGGGGRLVNVSARPALVPAGGMIAYSCSKAAVAALTEGLAVELGDRGILVNAVVPSIIDSPANRVSMPGADHDAWPKPSQLAKTIAFLASTDNQLSSGALVPVYGRS